MRHPLRAAPLAALSLLVALAGCDAAGPSLESAQAGPAGALAQGGKGGGQEKVAVCHYDAGADAYKLISVGAPALPAHLRHGDGVPGGAVPERDGFEFSDTCAPVPVEPVPVEPFTCEVEYSVTGEGQQLVRVSGKANDAAMLPTGFLSVTITNEAGLEPYAFETFYADIGGGAVTTAGVASTLVVTDPVAAEDATIALNFRTPTRDITCGPYPALAP